MMYVEIRRESTKNKHLATLCIIGQQYYAYMFKQQYHTSIESMYSCVIQYKTKCLYFLRFYDSVEVNWTVDMREGIFYGI